MQFNGIYPVFLVIFICSTILILFVPLLHYMNVAGQIWTYIFQLNRFEMTTKDIKNKNINFHPKVILYKHKSYTQMVKWGIYDNIHMMYKLHLSIKEIKEMRHGF